MGLLAPWLAAAGTADAPLLLRALQAAKGEEADLLFAYFVRHPDADALPFLRQLYDEPRLGRRNLAEALSACGDAAVVDAALELRAHRWNQAEVGWGMAVVAHSALPETADRLLALDPQERASMLIRYASEGYGTDDARPIRREVLEALLAGWDPNPYHFDAHLRALLAQRVADGEEWARPYLDSLGPPESLVVY
jgi:hypothetical protein